MTGRLGRDASEPARTSSGRKDGEGATGTPFGDIVAKTGYSLLILRVALLRPAADVGGGVDVHPEAIWVDQHRQSDPVLPPAFAPQPAEIPVPSGVPHTVAQGR